MKKLSVTMKKTEQWLGWAYFLFQLLVLPLAISYINFILGSPLSESWINIVYFSMNFLCVIGIFYRFLFANGQIALRTPFRCLRSAAVGLISYWLLSFCVQFFIAVADPDFFNVNDAYISDMAQENFRYLSFATVFLVPVAEETLFRGLIFGQLYNKSRLLAYLVSSLAFAAVHVVGYIGYYPPMQLLLCLVQYLPAGLSLGWAYANADSIWAPILIHVTINQIGILSMR